MMCLLFNQQSAISPAPKAMPPIIIILRPDLSRGCLVNLVVPIPKAMSPS